MRLYTVTNKDLLLRNRLRIFVPEHSRTFVWAGRNYENTLLFKLINRSIMRSLLCLILLCTLATSYAQTDQKKGLKDYYKDLFPIGVAVYPRALEGDTRDLILTEFNSMTAENVMKPEPLQPKEGQFYWEEADKVAAFAKSNNLYLRGHTLCWHNQTGDWMFKDGGGNTASKELLLRRLKEHIDTVVKRYKGTIYAWDVVNEAVSDKEGEFLRDSEWYRICGADYIIKAFQFAHEADPDAKLFYNDYSAIRPGKRDKICRLVKMIQDAGVPIHGVGIQGHISIYEPSESELRAAIEKYASLGVEVQITELDVSVYEKEHGRREPLPKDEDDAFKPHQEQKQIEQYDMFFKVLREYRNIVTSVTFWNISDRYSWLDNFPVVGRKNYPLLFDQNLQRKQAYQKVIDF